MRRFWSRTPGQQRDRREAQRQLWRHLRDRQLDGLRFRRQHPIAGYVAEFACVEAGLVVEFDRGDAPERREYDRRRAEILAMAGYGLLTFATGDALGQVEALLLRIRHQVQRQVVPARAAQP